MNMFALSHADQGGVRREYTGFGTLPPPPPPSKKKN